MISFKIITEENEKEVTAALSEDLSKDEKKIFLDVVAGLSFDMEDAEFAVCVNSGCALVRVFDMGKYFFLFPYELSEVADLSSAVYAVSEYAMREEIPLCFIDVPSECLSLFDGFLYAEATADNSCESFFVRIKTECDLLAEIPEIPLGRVVLNAIQKEDTEEYARLCKDENVNKYWGYNYKEDIKNPPDAYFYENALNEFSRRVSVPFAIRAEGKFIGEAIIYAFDGRGGAEGAVRILPEFQGRGFGKASVLATVEAARKIGLMNLHFKIRSENSPSVAMMQGVYDECTVSQGVYDFLIKLK